MSPYPIDLHTHTTASDGKDSPEELVAKAAAAGIHTLGVTDHDTVAGLARVADAAKSHKIRFFPGVEISTSLALDPANPGRRLPLHLLGYGFDETDEELLDTLAVHERARVVRMGQMIEKVNAIAAARGFHQDPTSPTRQDVISPEDVIRIAGPRGTTGRPHLAEAMVDAGLISNTDEAFEKWIGRSGPAYVKRAAVDTTEMVRLIRRAGGVPVLAHPQEYGDSAKLEKILVKLKDAGLLGMEVDYGSYDDATRKDLRSIADRHNLIPLGGSDYHGLARKPDRPLGMIEVDPEAVERLAAAIKHTRADRSGAPLPAARP